MRDYYRAWHAACSPTDATGPASMRTPKNAATIYDDVSDIYDQAGSTAIRPSGSPAPSGFSPEQRANRRRPFIRERLPLYPRGLRHVPLVSKRYTSFTRALGRGQTRAQ